MTAPTPRLGVFGGAFDPPHVAHVALARAAVEQLQLNELRVFPTGHAWHRANEPTSAAHRLAMARIAFEGLERTVVDDRELRRPGPTYTIDTLRELRAERPDAQFFLIMGEDQAAAFTRWRDWEEILRMAALCVAARPSAGTGAGAHELPAQADLRLLRLPPMPESATEVRHRAALGKGIDHLVPPGVAGYIAQNHLYQAT